VPTSQGGIRYKLPGPSGPEGLGPGPNMSHAFLSFSIGSHEIRKCFVAFTTLSARGHFAYDAAASFPYFFLAGPRLLGGSGPALRGPGDKWSESRAVPFISWKESLVPGE